MYHQDIALSDVDRVREIRGSFDRLMKSDVLELNKLLIGHGMKTIDVQRGARAQ